MIHPIIITSKGKTFNSIHSRNWFRAAWNIIGGTDPQLIEKLIKHIQTETK
jgi:hypothetical protein